VGLSLALLHKYKIFSLCLVLVCLGAASLVSDEMEVAAERTQAHLLIGDVKRACKEINLILDHPDQYKKPSNHRALISALAQGGSERELQKAWGEYRQEFPEDEDVEATAETVAWSILEHGMASPSIPIRHAALYAASIRQDSRSVAIIKKGMQDRNHLIRALAVHLSSRMHDNIFHQELISMLQNENHLGVRIEVIRSLGIMKVEKAKALLLETLTNDQIHAEERAAAVEAVVNLLDEMGREELMALAESPRSGFRQLAIAVIIHLDLYEYVDVLSSLTKDNHSEIRMLAFRGIGLIGPDLTQDTELLNLVKEGLNDCEARVGMTAAWTLASQNIEEGLDSLTRWLKSPDQDLRLIAAGALASISFKEPEKLLSLFRESEDPYLRLNLAMGLIAHRHGTEEASDLIEMVFTSKREKWCWLQGTHYKILAPSRLQPYFAVQDIEVQNLQARLDILNLIAIVDNEHSEVLIKDFLKSYRWGVTSSAALLLLEEGGSEALDVVKSLLHDENSRVRIQAALVLSLWGRDPEPISILEEAYKDADRGVKEQILEGVGRIGSKDSLPFLYDCLQEPYQILRLMSAIGIIEVLNA
jgi:HEAT repeat protein